MLPSMALFGLGLLLQMLGHVTCSGDHQGVAPHNPHILFLMVDEMDGRVLDDSSPQIKPPMPHLRALAEAGAYFPLAYTMAPQCVPARTSMLAGRYNSEMKVWDNGLGIVSVNGDAQQVDKHCVKTFSEELCLSFAKDQRVHGTFIDVLAESGYNVTLWGKVHAGAGLDRFHGKIDAFPFGAESAKSAGEFSRATGITPSQSIPSDLDVPDNVPWAAPSHLDYVATDKCASLLQGGLFQSSTPQFLYCSLLVPHPPYRTNSTYLSQLPPLGNLSVPNWRPKSEVHPADAYASKTKKMWLVDDADPALVEHFRRVYFSMCIEADELIGRILAGLREGGGFEHSYVMFVGDHGEHALENRQHGKNSMLEASSRVPFIITGPGIAEKQKVPALASLIDVYPTVLDMAQVHVSTVAEPSGESLLPVARGGQRQRDYVVAEYHSVYSATGTFMVRRGYLKLIVYAPVQPGDEPFPPQLFNLSADPWEHENLAASRPQDVEKLAVLLAQEIDMEAADAAKKAFDKAMFLRFWYTQHGGAAGCVQAMKKVYPGFDASRDALKVAKWLGKPCADGFNEEPTIVI